MLEKFDDRRIRLKRARSARARDALLPPGVDAYRTRYGSPIARYVVLASLLIGLVVLGLGVLGVLGLSLEDGIGAPIEPAVVSALIALTIVVLGILLLFVRRR